MNAKAIEHEARTIASLAVCWGVKFHYGERLVEHLIAYGRVMVHEPIPVTLEFCSTIVDLACLWGLPEGARLQLRTRLLTFGQEHTRRMLSAH